MAEKRPNLTAQEWEWVNKLLIERLSVAISIFHEMEQNNFLNPDQADYWRMVQEMLVGLRGSGAFAQIRDELFVKKRETKLAETRIRRWLNSSIATRRGKSSKSEAA